MQLAKNDALLTALADHLRLPLLQIARLSETKHQHALQRIGIISEQSLRLVDAYVMATTQQELLLEPISAGAVMADVAHVLDDFARAANYQIIIDQSTPTGLVMAHQPTLKMMFLMLGSSLIEAGLEREAIDRRLILGSHRSSRGVVVGAFNSSLELTQDVLNLTRQLHGRASQPAPALGGAGAAGLAIADNLSYQMQTPLKCYRHKALKGIGSLLLPTSQLELFV